MYIAKAALLLFSIVSISFAEEFPYKKIRAKNETSYILKKVIGLYENETGMAREYVSAQKYQSVIKSYKDIIQLIKVGKPPVLRPQKILKNSDSSSVLNKMTLVVHAYGNYDYFWSSSSELNRLIAIAQSEKQTIGFIVSDPENPDFLMMGKKPVYKTGHVSWMTEFKEPDFAVISPVGSHNITVFADEATIVGGYWNGCLTRAIKSLIWNRETYLQRNQSLNKILRINLHLKGIYRHYYNVASLVDTHNPQSIINFWNADNATLTRMPTGLEDFNYKVVVDGTTIINNVGSSSQQIIFNLIH